MRKILFSILLIMVSACFSNAQITITNSNMPSSSDTIRYTNTSAAGLNYDTTGANITWDFSTVTDINEGLYEYKPSLQINIAYSLFFGFGSYGLKILDSLNLGAFAINNVYDFYQNSSSTFKAVGRGMEFSGLPVPSFYSDDDEIYQFPLQYNDHDSSTYAVAFALASYLSLTQTGYRINEVDGYGTVITPFGTFSCLKVKTTLVETDSLVLNSFALPPFTRTTRQYKWLSTTEKIPVFEIDGNILAGNFIPTNARYRGIRNVPTSTNENPVSKTNIILYPNPVTNELTIHSDQLATVSEIKIFDIYGKEIYTNKITSETLNFIIQISNFTPGIYFLNILNTSGSYLQKFIKE